MSPGTFLATVTGAGRPAALYEIPHGAPFSELLALLGLAAEYHLLNATGQVDLPSIAGKRLLQFGVHIISTRTRSPVGAGLSGRRIAADGR